MNVFVTGGTGYIGRTLIQSLVHNDAVVRALSRPDSRIKLPPGCQPIIGNALDATTYQEQIAPAESFVHLVGTPHPGPGKKQQFHDVDLKSIECAVTAARFAGIRHFIYVSVAHPAPLMHDYIEVRTRGEDLIRDAGLNATLLGPGHWWPYALFPFYKVLEAIPSTRDGATRLGLVTHAQMVRALAHAVHHPATGISILTVTDIRRLGR